MNKQFPKLINNVYFTSGEYTPCDTRIDVDSETTIIVATHPNKVL
jgi:hypothetical protein